MVTVSDGYWLFNRIVILLFPLSFYMLYRGLRVFGGHTYYKKIREDVDKMIRQKAFKPMEMVTDELNNYFNQQKKNIRIAAGYFFLSMILVISSLLLIKNAETSSPVWSIILFVVVLFVFPILVIVVAYYDTKILKEETIERIIKDCTPKID